MSTSAPAPPLGSRTPPLEEMETALGNTFPVAGKLPETARQPALLHQRHYLVNGALHTWQGPVKTVFSPVCLRAGDVLEPVEIGSFPIMGEAEADAALAAAVAAYDHGCGLWPTMPVAARIRCIEDFARRMVALREQIVPLIMWEIGKSTTDSAKEFDRTVDYIRATIEALKEQDNNHSRFTLIENTIGLVRRTPLGVVLCMGPYNYPLNETFATLIPALIMGNTVVFKPPRFGVLLFAPLLEAFCQAFPKGVVNTLYGQGSVVVPRLMRSGQIDVLSLIGSSQVADQLKKQHPKAYRLRAVLGLDAKNVAIVLPDADLDLAVHECLLGALSFNGQRCTAIKMILVHRSLSEAFVQRFVAEVGKLKVGMPWEDGVSITPLPDQERLEYLRTCIADAVEKGAKIVNPGGGERCRTLMRPTVLYPVKEGMKLYREEQFGPIVPIGSFEILDSALDYIIGSNYGQQVSLFGSDPKQIGALVDPLVNQVCRVNLNCQCQRGPDIFPFTGRKDSAEGTLSVTDALRAFSIRSMIATRQNEVGKQLLEDIVQEHHSNFVNTHFIL